MPHIESVTFPLRLNINFSLSESVASHVTALNKVVVSRGFEEISFQQGSDHLPHITLLMGDISSERDLNVITRRLHTFCSTHAPLDYVVTAPYWKEPLLTYIFLDVEPAEGLRNFRVEMHEFLGNLIEYDDHGGPDSPSHITVGYCENRCVDFTGLGSEDQLLSGSASVVRLSVAGSRGTCREVIGMFSLGVVPS